MPAPTMQIVISGAVEVSELTTRNDRLGGWLAEHLRALRRP